MESREIFLDLGRFDRGVSNTGNRTKIINRT